MNKLLFLDINKINAVSFATAKVIAEYKQSKL